MSMYVCGYVHLCTVGHRNQKRGTPEDRVIGSCEHPSMGVGN